jgi:soluble lytic murein transglycosylase-like protein
MGLVFVAIVATSIFALPNVGRAEATSGAANEPASTERGSPAPAPQNSNFESPPAGQQPKLPTSASGPADYRALAAAEATRGGLPPEVADSIMAVESGYNPDAVGGAGEIGLMQILPSTARMLGFNGSNAELAVPQTNIRYGVAYLARAWRLAGGDICTAAMKYRAGHGETRFSYLSVNYCIAVRSKLMARGFRVTGTVPVATFGGAGGGKTAGLGCKRRCLGGGALGRIDFASLNTRLNALVVQVRTSR